MAIPGSVFPCTKCGACCRVLPAKFGKYYGIYTKPDGSCVFLTPDNLCSNYEQRPDVCRIQSDYERNAVCCNLLQIQLNIDPSFRVQVSDPPQTLRDPFQQRPLPILKAHQSRDLVP